MKNEMKKTKQKRSKAKRENEIKCHPLLLRDPLRRAPLLLSFLFAVLGKHLLCARHHAEVVGDNLFNPNEGRSRYSTCFSSQCMLV